MCIKGTPEAFLTSFPGTGHHWVSALGPYDEHLVADHGTYNVQSETGKFYKVSGTSGLRAHARRAVATAFRMFPSPRIECASARVSKSRAGAALSSASPVVRSPSISGSSRLRRTNCAKLAMRGCGARNRSRC